MDVFETANCDQLLGYRLQLVHVELESFEVARLENLAKNSSRQPLFRLLTINAEKLLLLLEGGVLHFEVLNFAI